MRALRRETILASILMLAMGSASAAPIGYASALEGLYQVDLGTGVATKVGNYGANIDDIEGLTYLPDGSLIGISDAKKGLYRISAGSGRGAFVATLDTQLRDFSALDLGLAAGCDGTLYASSDVERKLWRLAPNGTAVFISDLPAAISGLAFRDGMIYGVAITSPGATGGEGLWRIDPATGAATLVGGFTTPRAVRDAGLDFSADGRLWATFDYNPPTSGGLADFSDVAEIDPNTGALLSRRTVTSIAAGSDFEGLAVAPPVCAPDGVPEPVSRPVPATSTTSWVALVLGLLALGWFGLRRFAR
jgi:hypothetical protein